jgi:hypothetical protein
MARPSTDTLKATCNENPGFIPQASGGDGDSTQFWFVGYDPALEEVIVSHQGTNTSELWVTDLIALSSYFVSLLFRLPLLEVWLIRCF